MSAPDPEQSAFIEGEFKKLVTVGVLSYVIPTDPLGEAWVLGLPGMRLVHLDGNEDALSWLSGAGAVADWVAHQYEARYRPAGSAPDMGRFSKPR